jgi:hypothetical protein
MSFRGRCHKYLLAREATPDAAHRRDVIAVRADDDGPIKNIINCVLQECQREVDIGLFFLVAFPFSAALLALSALLAEPSHVAFHA